MVEDYSFNTLVNGYKVIDSNTNNILSPYITSRVLYDTTIHENVEFNKNGSVNSAHLVKSKWNNGLLKTKLIPGQLIDLEWKDKGCHGEWITNVKVPLQSDDKKPILSLQREWSF